jgi:c-di-GMP-binding flagellar brake protein YcgR
MTGAFSGLHLYPLQDNISYFKEDDPLGAAILGIGIGLIIISSMIVSFLRKRVAGDVGGGNFGTLIPRKFNGFTLRRISAYYGLNRDQTKLLEYVFRLDAVSDPLRVMENSDLLDKHFRQAYRIIEKNAESDEDAQIRLARLFSLRNTIDAAQGSGNTPPSTRQIADNTAAVLSTGRNSYSVKVISSKADNILTEYPRTALGNPIPLSKGTRVSLAFFTKSTKGFSFDSRVLGSTDTSQGLALQLAHSNRIKPLVQRRYRRKQTALVGIFSLVFADETRTGRKKVTKLIVDHRRHNGNILDISIGGCSIRTSSSVTVGSRLKITIYIADNTPVDVLGQVLRTNKSGAVGMVMHIKFLRVPRRTMNAINVLVFGFDED